MDGLAVGRIVHLRVERARAEGVVGKCQPAIVVTVWNDEPKAYVNLVVFRDGSNDSKYDGLGYNDKGEWTDPERGATLTKWETSIYEGTASREFHDPRTCTFS